MLVDLLTQQENKETTITVDTQGCSFCVTVEELMFERQLKQTCSVLKFRRKRGAAKGDMSSG